MHPNGVLRASPPTLSWLKKSSFDLKPLVPQSMSLNEPTSWAAYSPSPWCCSAFKHLATIWHLRRATGIQGMQGHAMLGRHHDHHGTLWPCSKSFSRLQEWLDSLDGRRTMFDFQISDAFAGIDVRLWYYLGLLGRTDYPAIDIFLGKAFKNRWKVQKAKEQNLTASDASQFATAEGTEPSHAHQDCRVSRFPPISSVWVSSSPGPTTHRQNHEHQKQYSNCQMFRNRFTFTVPATSAIVQSAESD